MRWSTKILLFAFVLMLALLVITHWLVSPSMVTEKPRGNVLAPTPRQRTDSIQGDSSSVMGALKRETVGPPLKEGMGNFTIVTLTYRAPKSLLATLKSFESSGLLEHPHLHEVLNYFQLFNERTDAALVSAVLNPTGARYRVIGRPQNLPVAEATILAMKEVKSDYILFIECDRPVYEFSNSRVTVARSINTALSYLHSGRADVFRLQLYAGPYLEGGPALPKNTYGATPFLHCTRAPLYESTGVCSSSKRRYGHVFYTAYCKHWKRLRSAGKQRDMCDSFCFVQWTKLFRENVTKLQSVEISPPAGGVVGNSDEDAVLCLTSETCNWTNQPTMYKKEWYFKAFVAPCMANRVACAGPPGRASAVRQEVFFLKHDQYWVDRRYKVCLGHGLFIHNEVDNRE